MVNKYKWVLLLVCAVTVIVYGAIAPSADPIKRGPYKGMVLIPAGTFTLTDAGPGLSMVDVSQAHGRVVTIPPFYMDVHPVTNESYREFVHWVRDSILIKHHGLTDYMTEANERGEQFIDWTKVSKNSPWSARNRNEPNIANAIEQLIQPDIHGIFMQKEYRTNLFVHQWVDEDAAFLARHDSTVSRDDFLRYTAIYPDTMVWMNDFTYSQNEPMVKAYFSHPSYNDYPVVGVSWVQAQAYNAWRTQVFRIEESLRKKDNPTIIDRFRLPTEAQWQYAANGGRGNLAYPWGSPGARNGGAILMANFKPGRGDYIEDGYVYTSPVGSFYPNDYGLYDMAGNVAEWTEDSYDESASTFLHDLSPAYPYRSREDDPAHLKRKVIKGGSWKDTQDFLRNDRSAYEYQDSARSYIGFRSISRVLGAN